LHLPLFILLFSKPSALFLIIPGYVEEEADVWTWKSLFRMACPFETEGGIILCGGVDAAGVVVAINYYCCSSGYICLDRRSEVPLVLMVIK
jgi:hypothetical protein